MDRASIVFFKIASAQARNAILEKLLKKQHGATYALFWNSYLKQLRPIDLRRNKIVHWAMVNNIGDGGAAAVTVTLSPPAFWDQTADTPTLNAADLVQFALKCSVYERLCNVFVMVTQPTSMPEERRRTLLDIFRQPLVYPLPAGHPLNS